MTYPIAPEPKSCGSNRKPGKCLACGGRVPAGEGNIWKSPIMGWSVYHAEGRCERGVSLRRVDTLKAGDQCVEGDGMLLDVVSVERVGQQIRVQFSAFGTGPAPSHTFRASTMVRVFAPEVEPS